MDVLEKCSLKTELMLFYVSDFFFDFIFRNKLVKDST